MAEALMPWDLVAGAFGLPVTVILAGEEATPATGVWVSPAMETFPSPLEGLARRDRIRVMALG